MLRSVVLRLTSRADATLPATTGNLVHGWFLELVAARDAGLAAELHGRSPIKPFTVSPLLGPFTRVDGQRLVRRGDRGMIRITGLNRAVGEVLSSLVADPPAELDLCCTRWALAGITADFRIHPLAGETTYEALYRKHIVRPARDRRIRLSFATPTTFRIRGVSIPLPLPHLVFASLAARWNSFAPVDLGSDVGDRAASSLVVSRYRLSTSMSDYGRYRMVGFVGDCEYLIRTDDDLYPRVFRMLADFAFFSGVGYKTTMGMGQVGREGKVDERFATW